MYNHFFLYLLSAKRSLLRSKNFEEGYTLAELLVSSLISVLILTSGYTLVTMTLQINKSDESSLKLSSKVDNALDFVVDEINSSKRILDNLGQVPSKCPKPKGEFVIGIKLPEQALDLSAYKTSNLSNKSKIWKEIDCPIIYTLQNDNKKGISGSYYKLMRRGPALNQKGYYIPSKIEDNLISDNIRHAPIDEMHCENMNNKKWTKRQVKGIIICTDINRKAAEIGISADDTINNYKSKFISRSSGGFSRIQDNDLMGDINQTGLSLGGGACFNNNACNIFGTNVSSRKITFFIDISGSMNWGRVRGKRPMDIAKEELIKSIRALRDGVKFQVIAFNHRSRKLFRGGPKELNSATRLQALNFVSRLYAGGGTNPWAGVDESMKSKEVGQIILMSDGWTSTHGWCTHKRRYMKYADCHSDYNKNIRANSPAGTVQIDTVSIKHDFCRSGWMGELSSKNDGKCSVIR